MSRENCSQWLANAGKSYPRTCKVCGLGPCRYITGMGEIIPLHEDEHVRKLLAAGMAGTNLIAKTEIEILFNKTTRTLHVNADGVCVLRLRAEPTCTVTVTGP